MKKLVETLWTVLLTLTTVVELKESKFFSLFSVVQFRNDECTSSLGKTGHCVTSSECSSLSGLASGSCAASFGVCCLKRNSICGSTIKTNLSYITNPSFPASLTTLTGSCLYSIQRLHNSNICAIRLNFDTFSIGSPSVATAAGNDGGQCLTDSLTFTTTEGRKYPVICGLNTGYHAILDLAGDGDEAMLNFVIGSGSSVEIKWEIQVIQLECGSFPHNSGCFQYYTGLTGRIFSFNWQNTQVQYHLASQDYAICIRQEKGNCCIEYQALTMFPNAGNNVDGWEIDDRVCPAECNSAATCSNDFLIIPNAGSNGQVVTFTRFCGDELNTFATIENHPVVSCSHPFILYFHSIQNGNRGNDRGFALTYRQLPCST